YHLIVEQAASIMFANYCNRRCIVGAVAGILAIATLTVGQETQPPPTDVPTLPPVRIEGTPPTLSPSFFAQDTGLTGTILDGTILSNAPAQGYRAPTSVSSTIIAVPDADLPGTVNTITRDTMNDQI